MKRLVRLAAMSLFAFVFGLGPFACVHAPAPGPSDVKGEDCTAAQQRLEALGCSWRKSARGIPFAQTCVELGAVGINLAPACIAAASSCEEAKSCRPL